MAASRAQRTTTASPAESRSTAAPAAARCSRATIWRPPGSSAISCTWSPSTIAAISVAANALPSAAEAEPASIVTFSGRMPISAAVPGCASPSPRTLRPPTCAIQAEPSASPIVPSRKFMSPMNPATNALAGWS